MANCPYDQKYGVKIVIQTGENDSKLGCLNNTPGTADGPGGRDRTLAVAITLAKMTFFSGGKKNYPKKIFFYCIYLLVMPILGETNFHAREIPRSG